MGGVSGHDAAFADMIQGLKDDAVNRGVTALMDEEVSTLGVPDPRILIVGCGGSGNNTLNRITHLGVEGAVTVAINTDKQHLDHTRALAKTPRRPTHHPWIGCRWRPVHRPTLRRSRS